MALWAHSAGSFGWSGLMSGLGFVRCAPGRALVLGPILFLVFVGGLPRVIRSSVRRQLCPVWEHVLNSGLFGHAGEPRWLGAVGG